MRSPSVSERFAVAVAAAVAVFAATAGARADDKQVCSDAYDRTQSLRREGKLIAAREQAVICGRDSCAEFVRVDCGNWIAEIEASQPTFVFEARDAAGRDLADVAVSLDGASWITSLDGKARAVDPGKHTFRFSSGALSAVEETVVAREGEKNKHVTVTLGAPTAAPVSEPPLPDDVAADVAEDEGEDILLAPWIIGGVGVASLAVGGVLAIVVAGDKSTFDEHCSEATETCDAEGIEAMKSGQTLGPISTVALIAGAVGVGVATVWLITDAASEPEAEQAASIGASANVSPDGGGIRLLGKF